MASSSLSSIQKRFKYDLFMSFRGEDTRKNFVDHLYAALQRQGIHTFKDDKRLEKGKRIDNELIKAIEDSKLFIIIFSKTYASSSWCLDELVKIIECQNTTEQTAYPVFYDVEPTEVRKQSGVFGEAFAKHEFKESFGKWKEALEEAAKLAGWELKNTADGHEAEFIKKIVEKISLELRSINISVDEKLVGMESRIKDVELLLETGLDDVRMIGIKGIGGGGKTTLARAVFDKISFHFDGASFVENVREASQASLTGLKLLQKQVLLDVLKMKDIDVNSVYDGKNMMKKILNSTKVLLVLDDVDCIEQLEALAGDPSWFMAGSRIIITTRDEQVLMAHRANRIYGVNLLSAEEATCLFSRYAFGRDTPIQGYEDLSLKVVTYVAGLPLTTKVLGSFLCGKNELEWIDALERLETIPEKETTKILELSYMGLEDDYKEIFLNAACFMEEWKKDDAIFVLESCGFYAITGLKVLQQKSLITIFEDGDGDERIDMHDLIKEMGRNIVRRFNPDEPSTHSRLWIYEEIEDILANDMGTQATKYINVGEVEFCPETFMKGFGKMEKLIFLNIYVSEDVYFPHIGTSLKDGSSLEHGSSSNYMNIDQVRQYFPNSLRYLRWDGYHHCCLPKSFRATNLVALKMPGSKIQQLWEDGGRKVMKKLRFLDFNYSMLKTLGLETTPILERLDLEGCKYLKKLDTSSGYLPKLKSLCLSQSKLRSIDLRHAPNLEMLNIVQECDELVEINMPIQCLKLRSLRLSNFKLRTLDLRMAQNLETLDLKECYDLVELHLPDKCPKIRYLELSSLSKLRVLNIGLTPNLVEFYFVACPDFVEFYVPISSLKLRSLHLNLSKLRSLEIGPTPSLDNLWIEGCHDLVELHLLVGCPNLRELHIKHSKVRTLDLELVPNLDVLNLQDCDELVELHTPVNMSLNLGYLHLRHLKLRTLDIQLIPNLIALHLEDCDEMVEIHMPVNECSKLIYLHLRHLKLIKTLDLRLSPHLFSFHINDCPDLVQFTLHGIIPEMPKHLEQLKCLEKLVLSSLVTKHLPESIGMLNRLKSLKLQSCSVLEKLPEDIGRLECLEELILIECTSLTDIPISICMLKCLKSLKLESCSVLEKLPEDIGRLEYLEELILIECTSLTDIPISICMLKCLKSLKLEFCSVLEKLPEDIGRLDCLEELILSECTSLTDIPISICKMKHLKYISLFFCTRVEKLPQELGHLECLEELNVEGTGITQLPNNISLLKGLCVVGSRSLLQSSGFASQIHQSDDSNETFCYMYLE